MFAMSPERIEFFKAKVNFGADNLSIRFIPNRDGQDLQASFILSHDDASPTSNSRIRRRTPHGELHFQKSKCEQLMIS